MTGAGSGAEIIDECGAEKKKFRLATLDYSIPSKLFWVFIMSAPEPWSWIRDGYHGAGRGG